MGVASGKGESSRESTSLLGGGSNWHGFGGGAADFGSSDFQQTIIGEAVNLAVKDLSTGLIADNTKLEARTINVEGLVAAVDGGQIVLNVGGKAGLKVGDQLNVERITREIKDPSTGAVIRKMSSTVGVIKLTDVDDVSAVGTAVSGSGFKVGDAVRPSPSRENPYDARFNEQQICIRRRRGSSAPCVLVEAPLRSLSFTDRFA